MQRFSKRKINSKIFGNAVLHKLNDTKYALYIAIITEGKQDKAKTKRQSIDSARQVLLFWKCNIT